MIEVHHVNFVKVKKYSVISNYSEKDILFGLRKVILWNSQ